MKNLFTLTKMLLVAAMLCVGMSAWGTETGTIDFSSKSRCSYSTDTHTYTTASNAGNGYALAVADLSNLPNIASATSVTIEFDVVINGRLIIGIGDKNVRGTTANGSSKSSYNTEGIIMRYAKIDDNYVRVNGGSNNSDAIGVTSHVSFTLNRKIGKYSYTITGEGGTSTYFSGTNVSTSIGNATIVEAYSWANSQSNALSAVSYSYELEAYGYSVSAKDESGNTIKENLISNTSSDGTDVTIDCPYAFQEGGVWYVKTNTTYTVPVNYFDNNPSVTYKADPSIVYYSEGENLDSSTSSAGLSNGAYGHVSGGSGTSNKGKSIGTFGAGAYQAYAYFVSDNISKNRGFYIRNSNLANAEDANVLASVRTTTVGLYSTNTFTLSENTPLTVSGVTSSGKVNQSAEYDYILVRKLNVATLGTNGYATFACIYPLDLTSANLPGGLKAYKASVNGTTVTFTELNQTVPANTGVLLQGEASESYNIPVVASGTAVTENAFLVNADGTTFTGDDNYYYFGLKKNTLTFGSFDPSSVAIPASKAYLKVLKSSIDGGASARLSIIFDDETTGVVDVRSKMADVRGGYYNLSGQRVNQPQKGLYIVNGKKVIVK